MKFADAIIRKISRLRDGSLEAAEHYASVRSGVDPITRPHLDGKLHRSEQEEKRIASMCDELLAQISKMRESVQPTGETGCALFVMRDVPCSTCGAAVGEECAVYEPGFVIFVHKARHALALSVADLMLSGITSDVYHPEGAWKFVLDCSGRTFPESVCGCEHGDHAKADGIGFESDDPESWCLHCQALTVLDEYEGREPGSTVRRFYRSDEPCNEKPCEAWPQVAALLRANHRRWVLAEVWAVAASDPLGLQIKLQGGRQIYETAWAKMGPRADTVRLLYVRNDARGLHQVERKVAPDELVLVRRMEKPRENNGEFHSTAEEVR